MGAWCGGGISRCELIFTGAFGINRSFDGRLIQERCRNDEKENDDEKAKRDIQAAPRMRND